MNDRYDDDFVHWTERQASLLRRRAAGELANDVELDWLNLAEEIESVGASPNFTAFSTQAIDTTLNPNRALSTLPPMPPPTS